MANPESIRDKVAIVGVGACKFGENWDQSPSDMIVDAAYEAYADAGIEKPQEQIDAVFTGALYCGSPSPWFRTTARPEPTRFAVA